MEDTLLHTVATKFFLFYLHLISVFFLINFCITLTHGTKSRKSILRKTTHCTFEGYKLHSFLLLSKKHKTHTCHLIVFRSLTIEFDDGSRGVVHSSPVLVIRFICRVRRRPQKTHTRGRREYTLNEDG